MILRPMLRVRTDAAAFSVCSYVSKVLLAPWDLLYPCILLSKSA